MSANTSSGTTSSSDAFGAFGADGLVGQQPIVPAGGVVIQTFPPQQGGSPPPPPPPPAPPPAPMFGVLSGQTSSGIVLTSESSLSVDSGGIAIDTTVQSYGFIMVYGGVTSETTLSGYAAVEYAYSGSTLIDTTVYSGGSINLQPGGHLQGLTTIYSGGGIAGAAVDSGATLMLSAGAQLVNSTTVSSGGTVVVAGGEVVSAQPVVLKGGTLEIQSGGSVAETTVQFAGGGTLKIDDTHAFIPVVTGFDASDKIDLAAVAFLPGATTLAYSGLGTSGTAGALTVTDGAATATLTLIGQYAAANFTMMDDGHGGTEIHTGVGLLSSDPITISVQKTTS